MRARDKVAKYRCMEIYKQENGKVRKYVYQSKNDVNEQFRTKMNQDINANRKLFWKDVNKADG